MESSSQPFSYQLLDDDSIRLVTIKTGPWDSVIECEVEVERLQQGKNHFAALSYVWGDSNVRRTICLNGNTCEVTVNLFEGLRQIRESMFEDGTLPQLPIWVDAICINQDDKNEKAKQVPNMHQIYSTAEGVLLWLGVMLIPPDFLKPWIYDERYSWMGFDDEDCPMSEQLRADALERYVVYVRSPMYPIQRLSKRSTGKPRIQQLMNFESTCQWLERVQGYAVLAKTSHEFGFDGSVEGVVYTLVHGRLDPSMEITDLADGGYLPGHVVADTEAIEATLPVQGVYLSQGFLQRGASIWPMEIPQAEFGGSQSFKAVFETLPYVRSL
ncbi:HET domain-containing protein [Fusarium sp. LHS14.1]|nr:HET domain-containing protein [Fusarium sp. LHS14.1]